MGRDQLWVFDRPLVRDPLVWVAVVLGLARAVARGGQGVGLAGALVLVVLYLGGALLAVGTVGGSVREYRRARRGQTA